SGSFVRPFAPNLQASKVPSGPTIGNLLRSPARARVLPQGRGREAPGRRERRRGARALSAVLSSVFSFSATSALANTRRFYRLGGKHFSSRGSVSSLRGRFGGGRRGDFAAFADDDP